LEEFERFDAAYGKVVWDEVLKVRRETEGNPNWVPSWIESVRYHNEVYKILREQFDAARRMPSPNSGGSTGFTVRLQMECLSAITGIRRQLSDSFISLSIVRHMGTPHTQHNKGLRIYWFVRVRESPFETTKSGTIKVRRMREPCELAIGINRTVGQSLTV